MGKNINEQFNESRKHFDKVVNNKISLTEQSSPVNGLIYNGMVSMGGSAVSWNGQTPSTDFIFHESSQPSVGETIEFTVGSTSYIRYVTSVGGCIYFRGSNNINVFRIDSPLPMSSNSQVTNQQHLSNSSCSQSQGYYTMSFEVISWEVVNLPAGCTVTSALNHVPGTSLSDMPSMTWSNHGPGSGKCCFNDNSGCKRTASGNYCDTCDCDTTGSWVGFGSGDPCGEVNGPCEDVNCGGSTTTGNYGTGPGTGNSAWNCFTKDSMVIMDNDEEKKISDVNVGDVVKSEDGYSNVVGIDIHKGEFEVYSFNGGDGFVTSEHPFKTTDGWKAINPIKAFEDHKVKSTVLKEGNVLITINGEEELISIIKDEDKTNVVYNLKLDNEHVYYVNGYLVHNAKINYGQTRDNEPIRPENDNKSTTGKSGGGKDRGVGVKNRTNFKR